MRRIAQTVAVITGAPQTPWRAMRQSTGLSLREISRRTGINSGRLSIIERGVPPTADEARLLREVLGQELLTDRVAS